MPVKETRTVALTLFLKFNEVELYFITSLLVFKHFGSKIGGAFKNVLTKI